MKNVSLLETSIAVGLARKFDTAYKNSWISGSREKFLNRVKVCFRYSFLGRITEAGTEDNREIFYDSKIVRWIVNRKSIIKPAIVNYADSSIIMNSAVEAKKELYFLPVKTGGTVVFTAILTNMLLSLLLQKEIGTLGWLIIALLLFAAFWGMFCEVGWEELKKTSWLIRHVEKRGLLRPPQADSQ